jgi:uncharacterized FlgJ-related protein
MKLLNIIEQLVTDKKTSSPLNVYNYNDKSLTQQQFTPENFAKEVVNSGIKYPDVAIAQSMIETGHFKSNIFKSNNNLFGMKLAKQRKTTAAGEQNGHAKYKSWIDSVKDYKLWQDSYKMNNLSKEQYIAKLNSIYCIPPSCGNENYSKLVNGVLGRANSLINSKV